MVRQLTAIMFTDMAGYTALMQKDERQAKLDRDRQRDVLEGSIARHGGRVLQYYGDGTLSVFRSAIEAVRSAVEIQEELRSDPPIPLRIGVHTGDVVHDEEGVFGDGVNVASRIQGLSVPGGIVISGKVFDEVKNHPEIRTRSLGAFNLKHVKHPTNLFAVTNDGLTVPEEQDIAPRRAGRGRSVAVLPFVNMSADPDNEFFSDGITEEIINALTRVNGLKVTARTSSFAFKRHSLDIREIADQLAVTHVLEGSVRRAGQRVRITAQLICASDGYHLFSETYDRSLEDIFSVQDEIARTIVEQLADHLGPVQTSAAPRAVTTGHSHDTEAYAEYLRGRFEWARYTPEGVRRSLGHFERSIEMDPDCALPYTGIATAYVYLGAIGHVPAGEAFSRAEQAAEKALELEPDAGESYLALAGVRLYHDWDFESAYRAFQKALSLTPGSAEAHHLYGMYLTATGDYEEAVEEYRTAVNLDPLSLPFNNSLARSLAVAGELEEARELIVRTIDTDPSFRSGIETLGWIHVANGEYDRALEAFGRIPKASGLEYAAASARGYVLAKLGRVAEAQAMLDVLHRRAVDQPDVTLDLDFALVYEGLGDRDRSLGCIQGAIDKRMGAVIQIASFPAWRDAQQDPRFQALLDRIGARRSVAA